MTSGFENYNSTLLKNTQQDGQPIFIGTPTRDGIVRIEWALSRFGQIVPCNWGYKTGFVPIPNASPMGYGVADAQNLIVRKFMEEGCEWLFLVEDDNLLPPDCFVRLNEYMRKKDVPIVSGLYFTKSIPSEPILYRGRGNSYYSDWKIGDSVWCDGVPTGALLVHRSIIEVLWNSSQEYAIGTDRTRRVFAYPQSISHDPEKGWDIAQGTTDLEWCSRIIVDNVFEKAGWKKYAEMRYPFLVDTNIFVGHIDPNGNVFPPPAERARWEK